MKKYVVLCEETVDNIEIESGVGMNELQIAKQLATTYISEYAYKPDKFLLCEGKRLFHFRMNLSSCYVKPTEKISQKTLKKTNAFVKEVLMCIFQESAEVVLYEYVFTPKQLNRFFQETQLHHEYFLSCTFEEVLLRKTNLTLKQPSNLYKLIKSLIYRDFPDWNTEVPKLDNPTVLLNRQKEILIHVYDDRGCDIFCRNEQDYLTLVALCKEKIASYTQDMVNQKYQIIDTSYGLRFKRMR